MENLINIEYLLWMATDLLQFCARPGGEKLEARSRRMEITNESVGSSRAVRWSVILSTPA